MTSFFIVSLGYALTGSPAYLYIEYVFDASIGPASLSSHWSTTNWGDRRRPKPLNEDDWIIPPNCLKPAGHHSAR